MKRSKMKSLDVCDCVCTKKAGRRQEIIAFVFSFQLMSQYLTDVYSRRSTMESFTAFLCPFNVKNYVGSDLLLVAIPMYETNVKNINRG